jgi:hypothetical protein
MKILERKADAVVYEFKPGPCLSSKIPVDMNSIFMKLYVT